MTKFRTNAVHEGVYKDKSYNSVTTPLYPSSTFYFDALGKNKGFDYTRTSNPTRVALEENLASLEGGVGCSATATGMAAVTAVLFMLKAGDHVVTSEDIYGGTYRLFDQIFPNLGIEVSFVPMNNLEATKKAFKKNTKMVWIETPSNPLLNIVDLKATIKLAKKHKCISVVDNTFLTPYLQKPIECGADIVVHSTTKYINGHSDVVGGAVIYANKKLEEQGRYLVNALGVSQSPWDAWLVLRGVKTLPQRMDAHQDNAKAVAKYLDKHKAVKKVYYPGLKSHPWQNIIKKQMKGPGAMISFELDSKKVPLKKFFKSIEMFCIAESLGGVESLIEHPWSMSHVSMGEKGLKASGITKETIRISIGIEDKQDIIDALAKALKS